MSRTADERSGAVDGLRGLAALMVVASHASAMGNHLLPGLSLEGIGKAGVYLFFVISAFLLTAQWLRIDAAQRHAPRALAAYLLRRVARIYPLYTLVLLAGWALPPPGLGIPLDTAAVWRHLSLQDGQGIYWSIPVEFLYYLVIPPLAWWLLLDIALWLRAAGAITLLAGGMWFYPAGETPLNSFQLGYYLPSLLCGSLAAWAVHLWPPEQWLAPRSRSWADALAWLLLGLTVPAVFTGFGWGQGVASLHQSYLVWGIFWSLLLVGVRSGHLALSARVLRWPGLAACGRWCFGIYLLHMPALLVAKRLPAPGFVKAWLGLVLTLALAALAWRVIERPAMRRAARWANSIAPRRPTV